MCRVGLILVLLLLLLPKLVSASPILNTSVALEEEQYSMDPSPTQRIDLGAGIRSEDTLGDAPLTPMMEARFYGFYEAGTYGDHSADIDSTALRVPVTDNAHLWFGRVQPLSEGYNQVQLTSTDAIGANWVQNQSDALNPRVSGWIGTGMHVRLDSGITFTTAYSPIFLPSFGPRIDYSTDQDSSGSRFARLPPQCAWINGQCYPLRYDIDVGDIRNILLQNQGFASFGYESKLIDAHAMFWSAPSPSPSVATQAELHFQTDQDLNVMVTAKPDFERQDFAGFELSIPALLVVPTLAAAYETQTGAIAVSGRLDFLSRFSLGYLTTINNPASNSPIFTPIYANRLLWCEIAQPITNWIRPSLRIEEHLVPGATDHWINLKVDVLVDKKTTLFASANILSGGDDSYYGTWRALGSVAFGGRYQW